MRIVNDAAEKVLGPMFAGPLQMSDVRKKWNGSTMEFSLTAGLSAVRVGWEHSVSPTPRLSRA